MSYPTKSERSACWESRDKYWECLDLNTDDQNACMKWRKEFEAKCSSQWVKHFDRKRNYEKYKKEINYELPLSKE